MNCVCTVAVFHKWNLHDYRKKQRGRANLPYLEFRCFFREPVMSDVKLQQ
jgi:hypothetical protein